MSEKDLIYSITFPSPLEVYAEADKQINGTARKRNNTNRQTAEEYFKQLEENTGYVTNEEKERNKETFIEAVKFLAETLEIDTDIYKKEWGYTANVKVRVVMMGDGISKKIIIKTLLMVDSFRITKANINQDYDFILTLDYNIRNRIKPIKTSNHQSTPGFKL